MNQFEVNATSRAAEGKGASRRLRHAGQVPAIMYGGDKEPTPISLSHNEMLQHMEHEAFYSHILKINLEGQVERAVLKDVQRHPAKLQILHVDFQRIDEDTKLHMHVPLHFLNEDTCPGVKTEGGHITHETTEVEIHCLPKDLPEFIEVDLAEAHTGDVVHLSDLKMPEGVSLVALEHGADHDLPVVHVHKKHGGDDEAAEEAAE